MSNVGPIQQLTYSPAFNWIRGITSIKGWTMFDIKPAAIPHKNQHDFIDESCFTYSFRFISNVIADIKEYTCCQRYLAITGWLCVQRIETAFRDCDFNWNFVTITHRHVFSRPIVTFIYQQTICLTFSTPSVYWIHFGTYHHSHITGLVYSYYLNTLNTP